MLRSVFLSGNLGVLYGSCAYRDKKLSGVFVRFRAPLIPCVLAVQAILAKYS
jgi:hypothetical protein